MVAVFVGDGEGNGHWQVHCNRSLLIECVVMWSGGAVRRADVGASQIVWSVGVGHSQPV